MATSAISIGSAGVLGQSTPGNGIDLLPLHPARRSAAFAMALLGVWYWIVTAAALTPLFRYGLMAGHNITGGQSLVLLYPIYILGSVFAGVLAGLIFFLGFIHLMLAMSIRRGGQTTPAAAILLLLFEMLVGIWISWQMLMGDTRVGSLAALAGRIDQLGSASLLLLITPGLLTVAILMLLRIRGVGHR